MATAADYRKWAKECFEWAREAADESVREQYASLGRVWLECAARAELQSGVMAAPEPKPGRRWPSRGKRRAAINVARRRVARLAFFTILRDSKNCRLSVHGNRASA